MSISKHTYYRKSIFGSNFVKSTWAERREANKRWKLAKSRSSILSEEKHPDCYYKGLEYLDEYGMR